MRTDYKTCAYLQAIDAFADGKLEDLGVHERYRADPGVTRLGTDVDPEDDLGDSVHQLSTFWSVEKVDESHLELNTGTSVLRIGKKLLGGFVTTEAGTISIIDIDTDGSELPQTERAVRYNLSRDSVMGWDLRNPDTAKELPACGLLHLLKDVVVLIEAINNQE